jgi:hypothetical protein
VVTFGGLLVNTFEDLLLLWPHLEGSYSDEGFLIGTLGVSHRDIGRDFICCLFLSEGSLLGGLFLARAFCGDVVVDIFQAMVLFNFFGAVFIFLGNYL